MPKIESSTRPVGHMAESRQHSPYSFHENILQTQSHHRTRVRARLHRTVPQRQRSRRDVNDFLSRHPDLDSLSRQIADEIGHGEYRFAPIRYFRRVEPISGKIRVIGRESIRHQIYDYVCGTALMPLFRAKVGRWQTASIPGRGIADARRAIERWVREPSSKAFVKLDVRKCYPSISREVLKRLLSRDVGDRRLLDLTFHLIDQYAGDDGLNIGSYLSQWLANYYLSYAYHYCERHLSKERVNRRTGETTTRRLVTHMLFYMDDILLVGRSKRDLTIAVKRIRAYLHDTLRLEIHPTWNVKHVGVEPIDMVGFTFYPDHTGVRAGILPARTTLIPPIRAEPYESSARIPVAPATTAGSKTAIPSNTGVETTSIKSSASPETPSRQAERKDNR